MFTWRNRFIEPPVEITVIAYIHPVYGQGEFSYRRRLRAVVSTPMATSRSRVPTSQRGGTGCLSLRERSRSCRSPSASSPIDAWNGSVAMATLRHTERRALLHDVPRVCLVIAPVVNRHGTAWRIVAGASPAVNVNSYHQRRQGSTPHGLGKLHELDRVIHESRLSLDGIGSGTAEQQAACSASHGHPHTLPRYIDIPLTTSFGV